MLIYVIHFVHIKGVYKCMLARANLIYIRCIHYNFRDRIKELWLRFLTVNIRVVSTMGTLTIFPHVSRGPSIKTLVWRGMHYVAGISCRISSCNTLI
jgi:hypothetical protein